MTDEHNDYGKFGTAEELLAAYNALEREFTKKCQLVSKLQAHAEPDAASAAADGAQGEGSCAQAEDAPDAVVTAAAEVEVHVPDKPSDTPATITQSAPERDVMDEIAAHAADYAEALSAIPQVMDACVALYKQRLIGAGSVAASPRGMAVIMPAKRPRTLADAKKIADELLG